MSHYRIITSLALGVWLTGCNDSNFSGSSGGAPRARPLTPEPGPEEEAQERQARVTLSVDETTKASEIPGVSSEKITAATSDDPQIASVSRDGTITGKKAGTTTITITHEDGSTSIIKVTVKDTPYQRPIGEDDTGEGPILIPEGSFSGTYLAKPLAPDSTVSIWAATSDGKVYWFRLEGDVVVQTKKWQGMGPGAAGSRTYVTEKGLVVARAGGYLYWIDPAKTPEGQLAQNLPTFYRLPNVNNGQRVCIVSYRKDKKRYVGMGWGNGKFIEFPMEDTAPYAPKWGVTPQTVDVPGVNWGYSCFIDQERLIYYSQFGGGAVGAVDLKAMRPVDPKTVAPNANFNSTNINATVGVNQGGSYAMGGDLSGNVFNGRGFYTLAHERNSRTVWGAAGGVLNLFPDKCLTKEATCSGHAAFPMAQLNANVGPLSAIGDGRMVGIQRGAGSVYLMSLKDKKDLSKGINVTRIAGVEGDPYMYTDFTGATLYLTKSNTNFDLSAGQGFDPGKPVRSIGFTWLARVGTDETWDNLSLEIRCYKKGETPGGFEAIDSVKDSGKQTITKTASCAGKQVDQVDIRVNQLNDDDSMMNIVKVQVTAFQ